MKRSLLCVLALLFFTSGMHAMMVFMQVYNATCTGNNGGAMVVEVNGGTPPFTYAWSTGATEDYVTGLTPGNYSLTVTDALNVQETLTFDVTAETIISQPYPFQVGLDGLEPCAGSCDGGFRLHLPTVMGGYAFTTDPPMTQGIAGNVISQQVEVFTHYEFAGACSGQTVEITMSIPGCATQTSTFAIHLAETPTITPMGIVGSCTGADDGSFTAEITFDTIYSLAPHWGMHVVDDQQEEVAGSTVGPNTTQFIGLHPGNWTFELVNSSYDGSQQGDCIHSVPFTIPDLGSACGDVSGTVHFEIDADCSQELGEVGIPYQVLRFTPGPFYGITDANGHYAATIPYDDYELEQLNGNAVQLCPATAPIPFSITGPDVVIDIADSMITPFDASVSLAASTARPGFTFYYNVLLSNLSGHPGDNVTVSLSYDPLFTFVSATPGLTVNDPGAAQWDLPALLPFEQRHLQLRLEVPADPGLIGTSHLAQVSVASSTFDGDLANNAATRTHIVQGSYDPNDKQAFTSSGLSASLYFIDQDQYIDFLVRFQNTGTDTAFTVAITDTLSAWLDMNTLQILGSSHVFTPMVREDNVLEFTFTNILLPDSNTNELESHGFIAFRVRPIAGITVGEMIHNAADIYFDFNPPVRTNTATLETEVSTGIVHQEFPLLHVSPVPAAEQLNVRVSDHRIQAMTVIGPDGRVVNTYGAASSIDVSELTAGVYVLRVQLDNAMVLQTRFVKR
jgi:uncharacterized repeat protein (TIGR01451 family)